MSKMLKMLKNKSGFTLTEVLIAVLVLVTAIVASTNLVVSMIRSNSTNLSYLQAYYYAEEGVEAFRNMRDTHFLHNLDFRGKGANIWDFQDGFSDNGDYVVVVNSGNFNSSEMATKDNLRMYSPWKISKAEVGVGVGAGEKVKFQKSSAGQAGQEDTIFERVCSVVGDASGVAAVSVSCKVSWDGGGSEKDVTLTAILTDWKND